MEDLISGTVSALASLTVGHPLDTVKVVQQCDTDGRVGNIRGAISTLWRSEGMRGLFRGFTAPLVGVTPQNALVFVSYGAINKWVASSEHHRPDSLSQAYLSGLASGTLYSFVAAPVELVKLRLQAQDAEHKKFENARACVRHAVQNGGIARGLYRGYGVTWIRDAPSFGVYFATYEWMRKLLKLPEEHDNTWNAVNFCKTMIAGGTAGSATWALVFPLDAVKTRYQNDAEGIYSSTWQCARTIFAQEGVRGFTRGFSACVLRAFPVNAVQFATYELLMSFLRERQ